MNAKNSLSKLEKEYKEVIAELKEESLPNKFWLVPRLVPGTDEEYYWKSTYPIYERHNNKQQERVNRLNTYAIELYRQITRIKNMSVVRRFFVV